MERQPNCDQHWGSSAAQSVLHPVLGRSRLEVSSKPGNLCSLTPRWAPVCKNASAGLSSPTSGFQAQENKYRTTQAVWCIWKIPPFQSLFWALHDSTVVISSKELKITLIFRSWKHVRLFHGGRKYKKCQPLKAVFHPLEQDCAFREAFRHVQIFWVVPF